MSEQEHDELQRIGFDHLTADSSAVVTDDPEPGSSSYTLPKGRLWPAPTRLHPSALVLDYTRQLVRIWIVIVIEMWRNGKDSLGKDRFSK